ncbi:MAG: TlpA family protein disulfide reductase [Catonella sp.]|uniref:TlpA family protein disulfide reductase n=1 Tax=Catonella sp. TaxID=2382125 RepID=UPI003FA132F6
MKRKLFGLILAASLVVTACSGAGGNASAPKDDSKVASEAGSKEASSSEVTDSKVSPAMKEENATSTDEKKEKFPEFKTTDINGNEVTEKIFADKDITMVNVWGTFCGPCINEMPELQKIYESLPENANLIGIVADVPEGMKDGIDNAKYIEGQTGVKYTNLTLSDSLASFAKRFYAVPSTIFVDKEGNIIGDLVMGADIDAYVANLQKVLTDWKYKE